jgi:holliday junction DNA helicase RuvA
MIAKLRGIVDSLGEDWAVIDVAGVGYMVFCSGRTLGRLAVGEAATLFIETHVREDHFHLYGFADAGERDWYRILTTVQGVGAKVGLAILSVMGAEELTQAIAAQDRAAITRAPGVGPKLATRIVTELKDKVGGLVLGPSAALPGAPAASPAMAAISDAASALVNLGYQRSEALAVVSRVAGNLGEGAAVEALIRAALAELAPRETGR